MTLEVGLTTDTPIWYVKQNLLRSHRILYVVDNLWKILRRFLSGMFRMPMGRLGMQWPPEFGSAKKWSRVPFMLRLDLPVYGKCVIK